MTTEETLDLIRTTSAEAVLSHFAALPEKERKRHAAAIAKLFKAQQRVGVLWNARAKCEPPIDDIDALRVAMFATSNASTLLRAGHEMLPARLDLTVIMKALKPDCLQSWVDGLIELRPSFVGQVAPLWAAELCARPTSDAYILGYYGHFTGLGEDDPIFASTDVWRFFEVEGGGEFSLASHDKYCREEDRWSHRIAGMAARGQLDRARLLDASLDALERDFGQFRAGWYSRFHDLLEPTITEISARKARYLGLLDSTVPPTVSFALKAVQVLEREEQLDASELIMGLSGPLRARQKATQTLALRLIKSAAARAPELKEAAAIAATDALISEASDVQAKVLDVIDGLGMAAAPCVKAAVADYGDQVAPSLHSRIDSFGVKLSSTKPLSDNALQETAPVVPITPIDQPYEALLAFLSVLENPRDAMAVERAMDGMARHIAPLVTDARALSPLRKRALQLLSAPGDMTIRFLLAEFGYAVSSDAGPDDPFSATAAIERLPYIPEVSLLHVFRARACELANLVADGRRLPMLSAPTRSDGTVAASVLLERLSAYESASAVPGRTDLNLALLRLWADGAAGSASGKLANREISLAIDYALGADNKPGGDVALWASAWAARRPPEEDKRIAALVGHTLPECGRPTSFDVIVRRVERDIYNYCEVAVDTQPPCQNAPVSLIAAQYFPKPNLPFGAGAPCGLSAADVAWAALVRPLSPEAFFRHGFLALDPDQKLTDHFCRAYLGPLKRPGGPVGKVGRSMLAYYLASTDASLNELTVDTVGQLIAESRLDAMTFSEAVAPLLKTETLPIRRWTKAFAIIAEMSPRHATFIRSLVAELIDFAPEAAPRDMGGMLEMLFELHVAADAPLGHSRARACLAAVEGGGKLGRYARKLVALDG